MVEQTRRDLIFCAGDVVSVKGFRSLPERLRAIYEEIVAVIDRWGPHALSLEKAFVAYNVQSALRLGEVRGTILLAAAQAGLRIAEYNPTEIKTAVAGYGRADKMQIQKAVFAQLRHPDGEGGAFPSSLDATDALAAAILSLWGGTHVGCVAPGRRSCAAYEWDPFVLVARRFYRADCCSNAGSRTEEAWLTVSPGDTYDCASTWSTTRKDA